MRSQHVCARARVLMLMVMLGIVCVVGEVVSTHLPLSSPLWDLSGAALHPAVAKAPCSSIAIADECVRVSWSAPPITSVPDAPLLTYTVFASWSDGVGAQRSTRLCQSRSGEGEQCTAPSSSMPRGVQLTLRLLTECDDRTTLLCLPATSPPALFTLPAAGEREALSSPAAISQLSDAGSALCSLYQLTSAKAPWLQSTGWCNSSVSVCSSYGVGCNDAGDVVSLQLGSNGLSSNQGVDISSYLAQLPSLMQLDLSSNEELLLSMLDVSTLSHLEVLRLGDSTSLPVEQLLMLPTTSALRVLDISRSQWLLPAQWSAPLLEELDITLSAEPFQLASLWKLPNLQVFSAASSQLTSDVPAPNGLSGGALTHAILANLSDSNPLLRTFNISGTTLSFDMPGMFVNFPRIKAPSLMVLSLAGLSQLRLPTDAHLSSTWMHGLSKLQQVDVSGLTSVVLQTSSFLSARGLTSIAASDTNIVGDLVSDLCQLSDLTFLALDRSGVRSALPEDVSLCWPQLSALSIASANIFGSVPSFDGLPQLARLDLSNNDLSGDLSPNFLADSTELLELVLSENALTGPFPSLGSTPNLQRVRVDSNRLSGPIPPLSLSQLQSLAAQGNDLSGPLPQEFFDALPALREVILTQNKLNGSVPSPSSYRYFSLFSLSSNEFSGPLPRNIRAFAMDLGYNRFIGPISFPPPARPEDLVKYMPMGRAGNMTCPVDLSNLEGVDAIDIHGSGFEGCAFEEIIWPPDTVDKITALDVSDCLWAPFLFPLSLFPGLTFLKASNASVIGVPPPRVPLPQLNTLILDHNALQGLGARTQLVQLQDLVQTAPNMQQFSCSNCSLNLDWGEFISAINYQRFTPLPLIALQVAKNNLTGTLSRYLFNSQTPQLMWTMQTIDISSNPLLGGILPEASSIFTNIDFLNLGGTAVSGPLPDSWRLFVGLRQLELQSTPLQCALTVRGEKEHGVVECVLPSWMRLSNTSTIEGTLDPARPYIRGEFHCPSIEIVGPQSALSHVSLDESYYAHSFCSCDAGYFGVMGACFLCPSECDCHGSMVRNCYPVLTRGLVVLQPGPQRLLSLQPNPIIPFSLSMLLPCARTTTGQSLCNFKDADWPSFFYTTQEGADPVARVAHDFDLDGWCYAGHAGRMCGRCADGYYSQGKWCLRCLGTGAHVLILLANIAMGALLVGFLYTKAPGKQESQEGLQEYFALQKEVVLQPLVKPEEVFTPSADADVPSDSAAEAEPAAAVEADKHCEAINPLKLLVFHSQQLGLLLQTSASVPGPVANLLGLVSTGGNGFSLSALLALECLEQEWTLSSRCWFALAAPTVIGFVVLAQWIQQRGVAHASRVRFSGVNSEDETVGGEEEEGRVRATRVYGVAVALLYILVFPSAQTALSGLACTDLREYDSSDPSNSRIYLNAFPTIECNAEWQRTILPPALIGLLWWFIAFPLLSTLFFIRKRRDLLTSRDENVAAAAWPLISDLLQPFNARCWYWEQILLVRRLMLVACVAVVPSGSMYLPLCLLAIMQLSALLQLWQRPYRQLAMNAAELLSLSLLLLDYLSAVVFETGLAVGEGFAHSADTWAVVLVFMNAAFLLLLAGMLFSFVRNIGAKRLRDIQEWWAKRVRRAQLRRRATAKGSFASRSRGWNRPRSSSSSRSHQAAVVDDDEDDETYEPPQPRTASSAGHANGLNVALLDVRTSSSGSAAHEAHAHASASSLPAPRGSLSLEF